jgi:hypothetical protein
VGANVVVELNSESRARQPTTRAWAIIRRADHSHRLTSQRASRPDRRHADQPTGPTNPGARDDGRYPLTPTARPTGAVIQASAVHWLGEVGKTQLAIEYAHRYAADDDLV